MVRRARLPLGVHHRAGHPDRRVPGGVAADRRHRVRRSGAGLPHAAGVRPDRRPQRSGGALPHRGDDAAAAGRHRRPGVHRLLRRLHRAELLGAHSAVHPWRRLRGHRPAVRQGPRVLRVRPAVLPAGAHVPVRGDVPRVHRQPARPLPVRRHPALRARRCADPVGAHPADHAGRRPDAAEGTRVLVGPLRAAEPHPRWQAVHRRRLHRHQRRVAGQADPDGDRGDLRGGGVLRDCVARLADSSDRCSAAAVVVADRRRRLALGRRADQRQTQCGAKGKRIHQPKYHRDQTGLRP